MPPVQKVFIVDDRPVVLAALRGLLISMDGIEFSGAAENLGDVLQRFESTQPDLLISDYYLGETTANDFVHVVKKQFPKIKIILFTMANELEIGAPAFRDGVDGIVAKSSKIEVLRDAIDHVLAGKKWASPALAQHLLDNKNHQSPVELLTRREYQVFRLIGSGKKPESIAQALGISVKTVGSHNENIKKKFALPSIYELHALASNYVRNIQPPSARRSS